MEIRLVGCRSNPIVTRGCRFWGQLFACGTWAYRKRAHRGVFLNDLSPYLREFTRKPWKTRSTSATGVWTWHLPSSSFERYHSATGGTRNAIDSDTRCSGTYAQIWRLFEFYEQIWRGEHLQEPIERKINTITKKMLVHNKSRNACVHKNYSSNFWNSPFNSFLCSDKCVGYSVHI